MPVAASFDYAIFRLVPRVERGEFINIGLILFCRTQRFLETQFSIDEAKLNVLAPTFSPTEVEDHIALFMRISQGATDSGPIGQLSQAERFHWLVNPRSTVVQMSTVHSGLCDDPAEALAGLITRMVERQ